MELGSNILFLSIIFGILSLLSIILRELKEPGKKILFEKIITYSKQFIRATFIFITAGIGLLIYYLINSDFSIHYVWQYTSKDLPFIYKISALWTGEAGSMMFIAWMIILLVFWISEHHGQEAGFESRIQIIILIVGILFLFLTIIDSPFADTMKNNIPDDGAGLNPLLVNKWMIFHPPGIFIPYAILVIVFACTIIFLLNGNKEWEVFSRTYARIAWVILGAGMASGIIWSYEVWENYWIWDPAFTSILMTWLLLTAYLHSTSMYRKNWMKLLTPALASNVFISAMYSTYIIRSGTINSAHSFGEGSKIIYLLMFVILIAIISEGLLMHHFFSMKQKRMDKGSELLSNRNFFYVTIILLILLAFILFWGLSASLLLENFGASVSVNLYGTWSYPLSIALIAVLGICLLEIPGTQWIKGIIFVGVLIFMILLFKPFENIYTYLSAAILAFAGIGAMYKIFKCFNTKGIKNKFYLSAPHIVHLGIVIILIGTLMSTYTTSETLLFMKFNEKKTIGGYEIQLTDLAFPVDHKHASAVMTKIGKYNIYKDGVMVDSGEASFREIKGELITEPLIYRGTFADVYLRYQGIGSETPFFISVANVRVIPGMSILWGGCILVITGLIPVFWRKEIL